MNNKLACRCSVKPFTYLTAMSTDDTTPCGAASGHGDHRRGPLRVDALMEFAIMYTATRGPSALKIYLRSAMAERWYVSGPDRAFPRALGCVGTVPWPVWGYYPVHVGNAHPRVGEGVWRR